MKTNRLSFLLFCLLCLVIIINRMLLPRFDTQNVLAIISWDVFGYYLYLPATFIHHDLGIRNFAWVQQILDTYHPTIGFYQAYLSPGGDYVMKYPMGMAIMYSPFYFLGQVMVQFTSYSHDGFTPPYQLCIAIGGLFYTVAGLWFLRKILLRFFTDLVVAFTMLLIVAGTNYFQLTAFDGAMPHNYLFTLFALIVWFTIRWHENPLWKYAIPLGLFCGLATLIRPTAIIIALVPLLWGVWGKIAWREKMFLISRHLSQVLVMVFAMMLVIGLQMLYWKIHSGSWLYYSYEKGEKLEWIAPYLQKILFSYKKGWLVYTPLMVFALIGFWPLAVKNRPVFLAVSVFFLAHILIIASWSTWWYGGSFSQRSMMETYLLLALPLGALIQWISKQTPIARWGAGSVLFLIVFLNIFQTWQYMNFVLHPSRMTKAYYWAVFGKTRATDADRMFLEPTAINDEREFLPETGNYTSKVLATWNFETPDQAGAENLCRDTAYSGNYSLRMSKKLEFSPGINLPYKDVSQKDFAWIRVTAFVWFTCKPEEVLCGLVITGNQNGTACKYRMLELEKANLKPGIWNKVTMDYMTPFFDDKNNTLQAYFWYRGDTELLVDDMEIRLFERNE
jgi:glycosyltransferase involved in cell wall biosynthesis